MPTIEVRKARPNVIGLTMSAEMLAEIDAIVTSYEGMSRATVLRALLRRGLRARAAERKTHVGVADL